jgi:hypothetical protein
MTVYARAGAVLLLIAMACTALFGAYRHGQSVTGAEWQARWSERDTANATARVVAEAQARTLEQQRRQAIEEVQRDATQKLEQARTDADGANAAADRLREQVRKLLAAGDSGRNPGSAAGRTPAENPGNLLAVVLDQSVTRNRELAAIADTARVNGLACEAAYEAVMARHSSAN